MPADPKRVEALFHQALAAEDPLAFLAASGAEPDIRERVERLLAAHADLTAPGGLENTAETATFPVADPAGDADSPSAGSVIADKYTLVQEIGRGGMGTVWLAHQTAPVKRLVAVKLIKPGMDSRTVLGRFETERQALALMDHPNIAKVFDGGTTDGGRPFFAMEVVRGRPITEFCDGRHLTPRERLELFVPVCDAVQHAHQKGIIHRDLKPRNVLVALYDGKPIPKVIDFGIAKAIGPQPFDQTLLTGFGEIVGTPEYMSPEQAELTQLDIDTRTDIYALGALLYELLTGTTPLDRKQLRAAAVFEMLRQVRETDPPRPSDRLSSSDALPSIAANRQMEPQQLSRLVKRELDWIVMKCLEKDRTRRYETANGLARDVQRYLANEPVEARPSSVGYRARKFVRRNRGPVLAASLAVLCLLAGVVGTSFGLVEARRQRNDAEAARAAGQEDRDKAIAALGREHAALAARTAALDAVAAEKRQTDLALERERQTAYLHRVTLAHREWQMNDPVRAAELLDGCPQDLRAWEWYYVRGLLHTELVAFRGHKRQVTGVAFDPAGAQVTSADASAVTVWNAGTGAEALTLPKRENTAWSGAWSVAYSPDGKWLATGGFQTVAVRDARTGKEVWSARGHDSLVRGIVFSPDGKRVATASGIQHDPQRRDSGGEVKVWDTATGREHLRMPVRSTWANCVAFSPDGRFIAAGAGEVAVLAPPVPTEVLVWDADSGKEVVALKGHGFWVLGVAFSPDSQRLAAAGADRTVRVWDVPSGQAVHTLRGHTEWVRAVAFTPDGTELVSAGDDRVIRVWDAATGLERRAVRGHTRPVIALAINREGTRLASASGDDRAGGDVRVWDLNADQTARAYRDDGGRVTAVAFDPGGRRFASTSESMSSARPGQVLVREVESGRTTLKLAGRLMGFTAVRFAATGEFLAAGGDQGVNLWNPETGTALPTLRVRVFPMGGLAVSPDGKTIAAVRNGGVTLWDRASGQEVRAFAAHTINVTDVAFSPNGKQLATSSWGGWFARKVDGKERTEKLPNEVKVWDAETGQEIRTLPGGGLGLAYSADGKALVSGSQEGPVTVWDTATWEVRAALRGHAGVVRGVAFSPDGGRVVTAGGDRTVRLWDAATGQEAMALRGHDEPVSAVAFSPDGRYIVSGGGESGKPGQVRVWDAGVGYERHRNPNSGK
jgi:WD40 repeat protein/serine/threonine protein kinase